MSILWTVDNEINLLVPDSYLTFTFLQLGWSSRHLIFIQKSYRVDSVNFFFTLISDSGVVIVYLLVCGLGKGSHTFQLS